MKIALKISAGLLAVLVVAFIGLALFVRTLDPDQYRPQLVQTLSDKTGRKVSLNGPIAFSLGLDGVHVAVRDAAFGNPVWASRPNLASMGLFDVTLGIMPLLAHQIDVRNLAIEKADILLETNAAGQSNAVLDLAKPTETSKATPTATPAVTATLSAHAPVSAGLNINQITIADSQIGLRGKDGKISLYRVEKLTIDQQAGGLALHFIGAVNDEVVTAEVKAGLTDLLSRKAFPFTADIGYGPFHLTVQGTADAENSMASIDSYQVSSGKTTIKGKAAASWGGAHPDLHGELTSDHINLADFALAQTGVQTHAASTNTQAAPQAASQRMFSDAPLPLDGLAAIDADFQVKVGEWIQGQSALKNISARLLLFKGMLTLAPVQASVGGSPVNLEVKLNAATRPALFSLGVTAKDVDLGELQKLADMDPFLSGKAGAVVQLSGMGNSAHAMASSLVGVVTVTAEKGEIIGSAVSGISTALATIFAPQGSDSAINCLAARFIARNGVLTDNGILLDSAASAVAGKGGVNLGAETVDMVLHAKTKLVNIGGLVPPLTIGGTLAQPSYKVDAVGTVKNLVGTLVNGDAIVDAGGVPDLQTPPAGQNACVYTLDHPKVAASSSGVLPADMVGKASQKIQNLGNSLVKGLFGQ